MKTVDKLLLTAVVASLLLPGLAQARLFKWVDSEGNVHFSDRVPPEHAGHGREVRAADGRTLERIPPPPTREQLEAERRQRELAETQRREAEAAAAREAEADRILLLTYSTVADIERVRDDRLRNLETRSRLAASRVAAAEAQLEDARRQAASLERAGRSTAEAEARIGELRQRIEENQAAVVHLEAEQAALYAEFQGQIERFRTLRAAARP